MNYRHNLTSLAHNKSEVNILISNDQFSARVMGPLNFAHGENGKEYYVNDNGAIHFNLTCVTDIDDKVIFGQVCITIDLKGSS